MLEISQLFYRTLKKNKECGFKTTYILVDIHGTVLKPSKTDKKSSWYLDYYPGAKEVLRIFTRKSNIKLIMWSSSFEANLQNYQELFYRDGIIFDFIGENPEIPSDNISCYEKKFYYDLGLDDKHGFQAEIDWFNLLNYLNYIEDVKSLVNYIKPEEFKHYCETGNTDHYSPEICKDHIYHIIKKLSDITGE